MTAGKPRNGGQAVEPAVPNFLKLFVPTDTETLVHWLEACTRSPRTYPPDGVPHRDFSWHFKRTHFPRNPLATEVEGFLTVYYPPVTETPDGYQYLPSRESRVLFSLVPVGMERTEVTIECSRQEAWPFVQGLLKEMAECWPGISEAGKVGRTSAEEAGEVEPAMERPPVPAKPMHFNRWCDIWVLVGPQVGKLDWDGKKIHKWLNKQKGIKCRYATLLNIIKAGRQEWLDRKLETRK